MTASTRASSPSPTDRPLRAIALALRLANAENALHALTSGQVDAIVDAEGKTYLLRPAQEHLRQNEKRLQAVFESSADVITVVDRGGVILSQNHAARRVLGYEPAELVGNNFFQLIHEEDLAAAHFAFFHVVEGLQEHAMVQFRHRARDGSYRMIEATVGKLPDSSNAVFSLRLVASHRWESTGAAAREAAGIQASLAKDRFLAMLSHELRTPLTPVLLGVEELKEDERFAAARPALTMIRRNLELQLRLIEELSYFTTIGQHKVRMRPETIDAHEHVRFVLEICQSEIAAAQIEVLLDFRASENMVRADSVRLQQVLWNLLKNAIKFSPPGSSISITSTNDTDGSLTLAIADRGVGIDSELLPMVFDPFQQGNGSAQQLYGGLGLGLFIAKGMAEAQGGTLVALSEGRGKGATFRLTLNLAATSNPQTNGGDRPAV
jgi:PAS domain S-box-containing protein